MGVVNGLEVSVDKSNVVHVAPGIAIDCAGNELLLCSPRELAAPRRAGEFYVVLEYHETQINSVPVAPGSTDSMIVNSRIQKASVFPLRTPIRIRSTMGSAGHGRLRPSAPDIHCTASKRCKGLEGDAMRAAVIKAARLWSGKKFPPLQGED
jgi:hypothetical protein